MLNVKPYGKIWAVLSVDRDGNEGICMLNSPTGPVLAVTGSEAVLTKYLEVVTAIESRLEAHKQGFKIRVGEFTRSGSKDLSTEVM